MVGAVARGNSTSQRPVCSAIGRFSIEGGPDAVSVVGAPRYTSGSGREPSRPITIGAKKGQYDG